MNVFRKPSFIVASIAFAGTLAAPVAAQVPVQIPLGSKVGMPSNPGTYESLNRRDPFVTLIQPRKLASPTQVRPGTGLASFLVSDVVVTGIVAAPGHMMAVLQSVDKQSYVAKVKDRLSDAVVKSIDATSVVFIEVPEPGSYAKPREIRKMLHSADDKLHSDEVNR